MAQWVGQKFYVNVGGVQTNVSQAGANDGQAVAWAWGGTPPYTYEWNTVPVQTTQTISSLSPGSYTVKVTDNNGCVRFKAYNISLLRVPEAE